MDHDFPSSFRAILAAFAYFLLFFIHILSTMIITLMRYSMPSIACSPLLRATPHCHCLRNALRYARFSVVLQHHLLTKNLFRLPYYILDARCSTVSSASVPNSQKTLHRNLRDRGVTSMVAMATRL
jgi:hypothetical protein